jgi:CHASE1-domain containing sensor protein
MDNEILAIILTIVSTLTTALIGAVTYLFKSRKEQRNLKRLNEKQLEEFKIKYLVENETMRSVLACLEQTKATDPSEMLSAIHNILKKQTKI